MDEQIKLKACDPNYQKQYYHNNKDKYKGYSKKYYDNNLDRFKNYNRDQYLLNQEARIEYSICYKLKNSYNIDCECGSSVIKYGYYKHIQSKKHKAYLELQEIKNQDIKTVSF